MHSTNYRNSFILASADSDATTGVTPSKPGTIADLQLSLVQQRPYELTSDDLLFEVHAIRNGIAAEERESARAEFFAKPLACLRASPLVKQFGWGIHHDDNQRIAVYAVDSSEYRKLAELSDIKSLPGMRSKRAR